MSNKIKVLRSSVAGRRPTGREAGELYINTTDPAAGAVFDGGATHDFALLDVTNTFTKDQTIHGLTIGTGAGNQATSVAIGQGAGAAVDGGNSTAVGKSALALNAGSGNTAVGSGAGSAITTGAKNTIIGGYTGSAAPISATKSNHVVISDGDGNVREYFDDTGKQFIPGSTQLTNIGYIRMQNGLIMQWTGAPSMGLANNVLNLPIAFPTAFVSASVTINPGSSTGPSTPVGFQAPNNSQIQWVSSAALPTASAIYVIAIGY